MKNGHKVIDIHTHTYTREWIDYMAQRKESPFFEWTGSTSGVFKAAGVIAAHVDHAGDYDIETRLADMDKYDIDTQIITHTCPGVAEVSVVESIEWASRINDILAGYCKKYPGRFYFKATLPLQDIKKSLKEIDRVYNDLGAKGIQIFSNINGRLASSPEFHPIYERAAKYGLSVEIHPSHRPVTADAMKEAGLPFQLYGFTMDTTMVVTSLLYQGVFEKYPGLKVHHSHLGGMVPYMIGRVDNAFRRFNKEWGIELPKPPSEYYKNQVYVDTLSLHVPAMKCALEFMGVEHLLFGTDYPHRASGTVEENFVALDSMGLDEGKKGEILEKNATKLFNLN
jgi:predicted TIM-barrel fold metal-dependent hydrolase